MKVFLAAAAVLLLCASPAQARDFSPDEQAEVIRAAATLIEARYVDADEAAVIANDVRRMADARPSAMEGKDFAEEMTERFREVSGDGHLGLSYSEVPIPEQDGDARFDAAELTKWYGPQINHGVEKIERLEGNVMLLDLRVFPPPEIGGDVFAAAMTVVAQGGALIIDLRRNGGGGDTADLLTGYLVEGGSPLTGSYDRPNDTWRHISSPAWVPGRRFGNSKPLYILTSGRTFSAAEAFAYNLQTLKRATIVGEVTGGGAHPFEYRRVHPHFAVNLPEARSINPITGGNWQGVGVQPDVPVPADEALATALELARAAIASEAR